MELEIIERMKDFDLTKSILATVGFSKELDLDYIIDKNSQLKNGVFAFAWNIGPDRDGDTGSALINAWKEMQDDPLQDKMQSAAYNAFMYVYENMHDLEQIPNFNLNWNMAALIDEYITDWGLAPRCEKELIDLYKRRKLSKYTDTLLHALLSSARLTEQGDIDFWKEAIGKGDVFFSYLSLLAIDEEVSEEYFTAYVSDILNHIATPEFAISRIHFVLKEYRDKHAEKYSAKYDDAKKAFDAKGSEFGEAFEKLPKPEE